MEPGGFLPQLPSPPQSAVGSPSPHHPSLPVSRSHPLRRGSNKESAVIEHIDAKLLEISRRYEKRVNAGNGSDSDPKLQGYENFGQAAKDLEAVIEVVWVTGTPTLQTSYLLTIALAVSSYLPSFPFHPQPTFRCLHKLDLAFGSLLQGSNIETGERLPGFEGLLGARGIDTTKRVRMRGIVERTRVAVVEIAAKDDVVLDDGYTPQSTSDEEAAMEVGTTDDEEDEDMSDEGQGTLEMEVARVYEKTIVLLGESLDPSSTGDHG